MVGSSGSAWASISFVGDGLSPSYFIHPYDDGPGRFDGHNPDDDDDEQEHPDSQPNGDHAKVAVGVNGLAPYFGVLGSGVFDLRLLHLIPPAPTFAAAAVPPLATATPAVVAIPINPLPAAPPLVTSIEASSPHLILANMPEINKGMTASSHKR